MTDMELPDDTIADLQRRLDQQRELMTSSFLAMESAQAKIQQQGTALTNAFACFTVLLYCSFLS